MLCGAGEHDTKKVITLTCSALHKYCSDHGGLSLSPLQTEPATLDDGTKGSGSQHVKITSDLGTEDTATKAAQEEFENWVKQGGLGGEIASKLGTEKKEINIETAKEAATSMKPSRPPSDTVKGYPPGLDEPRPTTIEEYLRNIEVIFVIDDSGSMKGKRWTEARDALATIAQKAYELKVNTMNMCFLNNETYVRGLKGKKKLISLFNKVKPKGKTPLGIRLRKVFDEHLDRIDSAVREGPEKYSKILPLDIIVLTDGVPTDKGEDKPAKVVSKTVERLKGSHYHPNTMNVQIVQIANEKKAEKVLRKLVVGDNGRIVDTVPYAGIVDSKKLRKILLGGVHPNIRAQLPTAMLAT
ncbi:hypothetical protein M378DRAFT_758443 [Amanita muscaria Koide BX008]|uniref:VWFA domain-containing protein n=1 Tax=Amanita muscaria (strain Koide BX008) TaxID=946122 RepID=A0A0C2SHI1_AMAMK|nr:hypothetical protein M378DRAFT_758443 [Amanita muscaria Koide BX008]